MNLWLWWMMQTTAAVLLLTIFVLLACMALKNRPAWRHALWLVVLIKFVTPPIVSWPWSLEELARRVAMLQTAGEAESAPLSSVPGSGVDGEAANATRGGPVNPSVRALSLGEKTPADSNPEPSRRGDLVAEKSAPMSGPEHKPSLIRRASTQRLLVGFWCMGSVALLCVQVRRLLRGQAAVVRAGEAPRRLVAATAKVAHQLKIPAVPVRVTEEINSPFLWCFGWLALLWPSALTSDSDIERSQGIIAHELAHVRRRDHWVAWLELVAGIIWWWNPLFWFVRRQLRDSAEIACDAIALGIYDDRRAYAKMFLELSSSSQTGMPAPALGVSTGTPSSFERRLSMILNDRVSGKLSVWGILLIGGLAFCTVPNWLLAQPPTGEDGKLNRAQSDQTSEKLGRSVTAEEQIRILRESLQKSNSDRDALTEKLDAALQQLMLSSLDPAPNASPQQHESEREIQRRLLELDIKQAEALVSDRQAEIERLSSGLEDQLSTREEVDAARRGLRDASFDQERARLKLKLFDAQLRVTPAAGNDSSVQRDRADGVVTETFAGKGKQPATSQSASEQTTAVRSAVQREAENTDFTQLPPNASATDAFIKSQLSTQGLRPITERDHIMRWIESGPLSDDQVKRLLTWIESWSADDAIVRALTQPASENEDATTQALRTLYLRRVLDEFKQHVQK